MHPLHSKTAANIPNKECLWPENALVEIFWGKNLTVKNRICRPICDEKAHALTLAVYNND